MKNIYFDAAGNMTVRESFVSLNEAGKEVESHTQSEISAGQIARHLPMFEAEMTADQLAQAQAIIAAQGGA